MKNIQNTAKTALFGTKLPVNSPIVQMMINERITREDEVAQANYLSKGPERRAFYKEKLEGLIGRLIHHLRLYKLSPKDAINKANTLSLQDELLILLHSNVGLAQDFGLTKEHEALLLQDLD